MGKRKSLKLKTEAVQWNLASVILVIAFCVTLINQGGFYEGAIAFAGLIMTCFLFAKTEIRISASNGLLALFSVWYFFCSVKGGFVTEYAVKGLLPFVLFIFSVYVAQCPKQKEQIISGLLKFSLCLAVFSIIQCVVLSIQSGTFIRLLFPFNYSNTSGIYFAVCFFLCMDSEDKFLKRAGFVFALALLLTLSVGAATLSAIFLFAKLIQKKKLKELFILVALIAVSAIFLKDRLLQSGGTFLERLLQMHDGFLCIKKNPLFGIGAGRWEYAKQVYQTGFYTAKTIHSSIVQVGVDSGISGLLLFALTALAYLKDAFLSKRNFWLAIMIIAHSMVDFSLSFTAIGFLLILLTGNEPEKSYVLKKPAKYATVILCACVFLVSAFGLSTVKNFQNNLRTEPDFFVRHSVESAKKYAIYMNERQTAVPEDMFLIEHKPYELVLNEAQSRDDKEKHLVQTLESQPYNVKLMRFIEENCTQDTVRQAKALHKKAVASLSPIGEILYNLKGENQ